MRYGWKGKINAGNLAAVCFFLRCSVLLREGYDVLILVPKDGLLTHSANAISGSQISTRVTASWLTTYLWELQMLQPT